MRDVGVQKEQDRTITSTKGCTTKDVIKFLLVRTKMVEILDLAYHTDYISYAIVKDFYRKKGINVSGTGVSTAIKRLHNMGFIREGTSGLYTLTEKGRFFAECLHDFLKVDPIMSGKVWR